MLPEVWIPLSVDVERFTVTDFELLKPTPYKVKRLALSATASGNEVAVKKLELDVPEANVALEASASLKGNYPLTLGGKVDIKMAPVQKHTLALEASGDLAALKLDARMNGVLKAALKGQLDVLDPSLPFNLKLDSQHVQWPIQQKADFAGDNLTLTAKGSLDTYRFGFKGRVSGETIPTVNAGLNGQGTLKRVDLTKLSLATLGGTLDGTARVIWDPSVSWGAALDFADIQPGQQWPEAEGKLSGKVITSGRLTSAGGWQVKVPLLDVDGVLRQYPLNLKGNLDASDIRGKGDVSLKTSGLSLAHGPNTLTVNGKLDKNWDIRARLAFPELSATVPGLKGAVDGNVSFTGAMKTPDIGLNLKAHKVDWDNQASLDSLSIQGQVTPLPTASGKLVVEAEHGAYQDSVTLKSLTLDVSGSEANHRLSLDLKGKPAGAKLVLDGHLNRKTGWKGTLESSELDSPIGEWVLNKATALGFDFKTQQASVAAHCWQQGKSSLCLTKDAQVGEKGAASLALNAFDFNLIKPYMPRETKLTGTADATVVAAWAPDAAPSVTARVRLPQGQVTQQLDVPISVGWHDVELDADLKDNVLNTRWLLPVTDNGQISGNLTLDNLNSENRQVKGKLDIDKIDLAFLGPVVEPEAELASNVNARLTFNGPMLKPAVFGSLVIDGIKVNTTLSPILINSGKLALAFNGDNGKLDGKLVTPDGDLNLAGDADWQKLDAWLANLNINANELAVQLPPMVSLYVTPNLTLKAVPGKATVTGTVVVPKGSIIVEELPASAVSPSSDLVILNDKLEPVTHADKVPLAIDADINVQIKDKVRLEAFGLQTQLAGNLRVQNKDQGPLINGEINLVDGTYRSFGQDLQIRTGKIFFSGPPDQPYLNIEAIRNPESTEDDVIAGIRVTGPADSPKVDIFSDPAKPQAEALSYLLRGRSLDGESDSNMSSMLLGLGLAQSGKLVGEIGKAFGVQDLRLDTAGAGDDQKVEVSGYILPGLQIKYGVGLFNAVGEFTLRYRVMSNLYLEAVSGLSNAVDLLYQFDIK